ncbi:hypothetical protein [Psychrosphaera haliotis]|uniref:Uncharacterized protein n=1 Tax=Psychrosphaera haliotis TaxID=555083 RepID=A0A6N8F8A3_9GAMM|nr:hypothetical protein [Psychrosphaera haliotis]MUH72805.1 hypothetical protein [Psychrosphaera haliotis]
MDASSSIQYKLHDYKLPSSTRFIVSLIIFILFAKVFNLFSFAYTFDLNWLQIQTLSSLGIPKEDHLGMVYDFSQKSYFFVMMKFGLRDLLLYTVEVISLILLTIGYGQLLDSNITIKQLVAVGASIKLPYGVYLLFASTSFYFVGEKITKQLQYYTDISFNRFLIDNYPHSELLTSFLSLNITIALGIGVALYVLSKINEQRLLSLSNLLLVGMPILTIASIKYLIG